MKRFFKLTLLMIAVLLISGNQLYAALTSGETYTITIQKVNSDGTASDYSATTATADSNGKLIFSLTGMPTDAEANFFVFIIKDKNGTVVRRGFVPAAHAGSTNLVGVNDLSTAQTNAILEAGKVLKSDDPIAIAYLITLLRSPGATSTDAQLLAALGADAITGNSGFEGFLTSNGVTAAQLLAFKKALIYNATPGKKTITDLTKGFKDAVDSGDATKATQEMSKAGGQMADVFMDAAEAAGIDPNMILAAHDAAGDVAENPTNAARMAQISSSVRTSLGQSMDSFFQRIAGVKVQSEYTNALNALKATGPQVDKFTSAVTTMLNSFAATESKYGEFFMNPTDYLSKHPGTTADQIRTAIDSEFRTNFETFQTNMASDTTTDITPMKAAVVAAMQKQMPNFNANYLPDDFGTYMKFSSSGQTKVNWPIPQTVMVTWLAKLISGGGTMDYTRDTLAIPTMMQEWMGVCTIPGKNQGNCTGMGMMWNGTACVSTQYFNMSSCQGSGNTWTVQRRTYNTPSAAFNAYQGIMDDMHIIEFSKFDIYNNGKQPTRQAEKDAKLLFQTRMNALAGQITGSPTAAEKKAMIKLLTQPNMD